MSKRSQSAQPSPTAGSRAGRRAPRRLLVLALAGAALACAAFALRLRAGDSDAALRGLNTAQLAALAQMRPDDADVRRVLGDHLLAEKQAAAAGGEYEAALRLDPGSARAHFGLGKALYSQRRGDEALQHLRRASELDPRLAEAWYGQAVCLSGSNRDAEALDCLRRALALEDRSAEYHTAMGEILARQGRMAEALGHLQRAVQLDPHYGEGCAQLGHFLVTNPPDTASDAKAEALLRTATGLPSRRPAEVWFDLGLLYGRMDRPREAADALEHAVKLDGRDERFYYALASAARKLGDMKRAAEAEAQFTRISALHARMDHLNPIVAQDPRDAASRLALARVCRDLGLLPQAAMHYSRVARSGPPALQQEATAELAALQRASTTAAGQPAGRSR